MNKEEFIDVSKRMVKEYYNRYVSDDEDKIIEASDVELIEFEDDAEYYKIDLKTPDKKEMSYEVIYDKRRSELTSGIIFNAYFEGKEN